MGIINKILNELEAFKQYGTVVSKLSWGNKKEETYERLWTEMRLIGKQIDSISDDKEIKKLDARYWSLMDILEKMQANDPKLVEWVRFNLKTQIDS